MSAIAKELFEELHANGTKMAVLPIKRFLLRGAFHRAWSGDRQQGEFVIRIQRGGLHT